jgi:hypothetical protein
MYVCQFITESGDTTTRKDNWGCVAETIKSEASRFGNHVKSRGGEMGLRHAALAQDKPIRIEYGTPPFLTSDRAENMISCTSFSVLLDIDLCITQKTIKSAFAIV